VNYAAWDFIFPPKSSLHFKNAASVRNHQRREIAMNQQTLVHILTPKRGGNHQRLLDGGEIFAELFFKVSDMIAPPRGYSDAIGDDLSARFQAFSNENDLESARFDLEHTDAGHISMHMPIVVVGKDNAMHLTRVTVHKDTMRTPIMMTSREKLRVLSFAFGEELENGAEYRMIFGRCAEYQCLFAIAASHPDRWALINAIGVHEIPRQRDERHSPCVTDMVFKSTKKPYTDGTPNFSKTRNPIGAARFFMFLQQTRFMTRRMIILLLVVPADNENNRRSIVNNRDNRREESNTIVEVRDPIVEEPDPIVEHPVYGGKGLGKGLKQPPVFEQMTTTAADVYEKLEQNVFFSDNAKSYFRNYLESTIQCFHDQEICDALLETASDSTSDADLYARIGEISMHIREIAPDF
jgi:hypothetical protein